MDARSRESAIFRFRTLGGIGLSMALGLSSAAACSGTSDPSISNSPSGCQPDFASIKSKIFSVSCAASGCHGVVSPAGALDLARATEGDLVNASAGTCEGWTRVVPGDPDRSLLFAKISGHAPCGASMPQGGLLSASDAECVRAWIVALPSGSGSAGDAGADASACGDTSTDPANCGACGNVCSAGATCVAGACACSSPLSSCGKTCTNFENDRLNCGSCSKVCPSGATCASGACACSPGLTVCGTACTDTTTSATNCGACGNACAPGQTCSAGKCTCGNASVSFAGAVQPIFTASCANNGCHAGNQPKQGLNLSSGRAFGGLVGVPATECTDGRMRVRPGEPTTSYLIDKLSNVRLCGAGTQMPKTGVSVPTNQIQTIVNWICAGAPNN